MHEYNTTMSTQKGIHRRCFDAVHNGYVAILNNCINEGLDVNCQNYDGDTPLHLSAGSGKIKIVNILLEAGALSSVVNFEDQTPLHCAAGSGTTKEVSRLLESGASPCVVDNKGQTPLHCAAESGTIDTLRRLFDSEAIISAKDKDGQTPLHRAAGRGKAVILEFMLKSGASPSVVDVNDQTPLHYAAKKGTAEGVFHLLESGASPYVVDKNGDTPLHKAAVNDKRELVHRLLEIGASPSEVNNLGETPLQIAERGGRKEIVKLMLKSRKSPSVVNNLGVTPLHSVHVAVSGRTEVVYHLLKSGASQSVKDNEKYMDMPSNTDELATIQENIKEQIRKGTYMIEIARSDLVDFGGQRSFDMTHQLFMEPKGTFVLMFNGNKDDQNETTKAILKLWVDSILSYCADDEEILPIILFCAIHSDAFKQEVRIARERKLILYLTELFKSHKRKDQIIYNDIFFINGKKETDHEINRLESKLVDVAIKQNASGKQIYMAWDRLEIQLSELRMHNMNIISTEELITLNRRNKGHDLTDKQTKDFLNVQHSLGNILYFDQHGLDNFIIVQPLSLENILRSFIKDELFWPKDKELNGILCTLTNTGKIAKQDLLKLWSQEKFHQYMPNVDFKEFIIQVLVHLDILVETNHYSQEQESKDPSYLVPCRVKGILPMTYIKSANKMKCLSYTLLKSSIPAALSFRFIGAAMKLWPLKETKEGICLYHQATILCIDGSNELHLLV